MTSPFDPNAPASPNGNIYGLPFDVDSARVVILPVPWDVTVSYADGASRGPEAIRRASFQVDLYDPFVEDAWKIGLAMAPPSEELAAENARLRELAKRHIDRLALGEAVDADELAAVNAGCERMNAWVETKSASHLARGRKVAVLGGDHSSPLGLIRALSAGGGSFGILHIDAHADLRRAYEGFAFSHASILFNALGENGVSKLVQVGLRDFCEDEVELIRSRGIAAYFDRDLRRRMYRGESFQRICEEIVGLLPERVYVSFDIDGLDERYCPNTGTPVPGGLEYEEAFCLLETVVAAGREIIGFDLCEVAPGEDEWDANVGARVLYRLANLMAISPVR